ncbi:hypothetical protein BSL78_22718 [Apostichopus japonicus]|uniref:Tubulin-specific chaperone cofactor E-like protein n=1 Tax=Stichopus japonicus TaxID=307972 RepID=A0A2G8JXM1_STIJA|nr:hypothetical protein BSL78_22718 [Apostichopus japonicus]
MTGKSFVEAFTAKYLEEEEEDETDFGADDGIVILCPKSKPGANTFLRQVVLDHQNITSAGKLKEIADKVRNVTELDLSANPLGSWNVVESVIKFMPRLEFLNLASAELGSCSGADSIRCTRQGKERIEVLILNATNLSWPSVLSVLAGFPSVREVHLSLNEFSSIPTPSDGDPRFTSVKKLYFNDNMVTSWSEIAKLGQLFPNVENLLLVNNPLSGLTEDIGGHFACLKQLSTLDTNLSSWEDIDNFNHFPKLTEIQLRGIPLLKKLKEKESRQLVVARLPHVTKLNNSPISEPEREDAERAFIRKFMDSTEKPKRYEELSSVHKNVHRLAQVDMTVRKSPTHTTFAEAFFAKYPEEDEMDSHCEIKQIVLSRKHIIGAGDCQEIADELQDVTELDVSHNALCCWTEVRVTDVGPIGDLEELHFGTNNLASIPIPADGTCFTSVRKFYLNRNLLSKWSEIATLGKLFPSIESLHLAKNPLAGLTEDIGRHFACLRQLDITDINLSTWEELDNLNHFPKLEDVQLQGIPLLEELDEKESRELLIARLPKISKLNNSSISKSERDCAERAFIEKYSDIPEKPTRYDELLAIHHVEAN